MTPSVERSWQIDGYDCEVVLCGHDFPAPAPLQQEWRCGYVRVPPGHPCSGIGYNDPAPVELRDVLEGEPIGDRGAVDVFIHVMTPDDPPRFGILFDVHGGITFSGPRHGDDDHWIGFDCNHAGDDEDPKSLAFCEEHCGRIVRALQHFQTLMQGS